MAIAACTQDIQNKKSWYEEEYLQTIAKYKACNLQHEFPKAFAHLTMEMEDRVSASFGNDVLGEFFEQHISNGRNGQFFTPNTICQFMASIVHADGITESALNQPLRILDPACGSGRMLLASHRTHGPGHEYYGIDIDLSCAKMAALNLFLNGVWNSEVLCANALKPSDFVIAYHISFLPLGIFKIEDKVKSRLWHLHQQSFYSNELKDKSNTGECSPVFKEQVTKIGIQLDLF